MDTTTIALVGGGVIGAGWLARFVEHGYQVKVYDPDPEAARKIDAVLANAEQAYAKLHGRPGRVRGGYQRVDSIADAVTDATLAIESVPERLDIKQSVYAGIEQHASATTLIASSTSGILPTDLQAELEHPDRLLVAHPFNPVYLLPVVELVGGKKTSAACIEAAAAVFQSVGMSPLRVKKEIDAFIADRLLEAVWREALWLVKDGVATTEDIDEAIRLGFGLRWAQMGLFETYRIAGGEAGMRHFLAQFGPCLQWPWTKLMDVPELTDELIDTIAAQSDAQSGQWSIRELEQHRDDNLIAMLHGLRNNQWGAGKVLLKHEIGNLLSSLNAQRDILLAATAPLPSYEGRVPAHWVDFNGHMNESRYLECFSTATDYTMALIGVDDDYLANKGSFFTLETHLQHIDETQPGKAICVETLVAGADGKKLQLAHQMYAIDDNGEKRLLAVAEHFLIHVNLKTRKSSEPTSPVDAQMARIAAAHKDLPRPDGLGKAIVQLNGEA